MRVKAARAVENFPTRAAQAVVAAERARYDRACQLH
jgi:hypothetical protein